MDQARFDALSRAAASMRDRRNVARLVLGGVIGAGGLTAAGLTLAPAVEAQRGKKKKCKPGETKCKKKCVDLDTNAKNCGACKNACAFDIDCIGGVCQCRDLNAECETDGQCCSGVCSTEVISTCRKSNCVETGACGGDADCCGGFCVGGCCQGVC